MIEVGENKHQCFVRNTYNAVHRNGNEKTAFLTVMISSREEFHETITQI